ncbi:MAG: hypothetical protein L3J03_02445 [Desulfobacterales bacterium]|nr:hypothetical protein [Desulfobacterales bacterium]
MRCPKCAYISFDDLSSCASCGREFPGPDNQLQGTGVSVTAPFFLAATVDGMVDRGGALEPEGDDLAGALSGEEVDFQLEPEEEEVAAGGREIEPEADIDLELAVETGADEGVVPEATAEPEDDGGAVASGERISLVLEDESEPAIDLPADEEPPVTSADRAGEDEVLLDLAGLDDLDLGRDPASPVDDQPDLAVAEEEEFEDLFTDLDLFEDSGGDSVTDPLAGEEPGLTLALDDEGEKPVADPGSDPEAKAPDSGLTLEIDDE